MSRHTQLQRRPAVFDLFTQGVVRLTAIQKEPLGSRTFFATVFRMLIHYPTPPIQRLIFLV